MSIHFDPVSPVILVQAEIVGPVRRVRVELALDTGATRTSIRPRYLIAAGYNPARSGKQGQARTFTGGALVSIVDVAALICLERVRTNLPVFAYDMPPAITYDGLLGLDFFRGMILNLDFVRDRITLKTPRWWRFW